MRNKIIFYIILPSLLFVISLCMAVIFSSTYGITSLTYASKSNFYQTNNYQNILKGQKISGELIADGNNLGILSLHFSIKNKIDSEDEDILRFRIKEKNAHEWYYQNDYGTSLIYSIPVFPFGFPPIQNSDNKTYIFEITSLKGEKHNSVALTNSKINVVSSYKFEKNELKNNFELLKYFLSEKFILFFTNPTIVDKTFYSFIPFIGYLLWLLLDKKFKRGYAFCVVLILLALYSLISINIEMYTYIITVFWILFTFYYHLEYKISFILSLFAITLVFLCVVIGTHTVALNASFYSYMYLFVGTIQLIYQFNKPNKKFVSYSFFFNNIIKVIK